MFIAGCVNQIGAVPTEKLSAFAEALTEEFVADWQKRSLLVMKDAEVLKAKSPTDIDQLDPTKQARLWDLMQPLIAELQLQNQQIMYADVSCLPAKKWVEPHVDTILLHAMARRIHIPIVTNPGVQMGFVNAEGKIEKHHLAAGSIYEVNNLVPHSVVNRGSTDRWHVLLDVLDDELVPFVTGRETQQTVSHIVNFVLSPITIVKLKNAISQ